MRIFICTAALMISLTALTFATAGDEQAAAGAAYYNPYTGHTATASAAYNPTPVGRKKAGRRITRTRARPPNGRR